MDINGPSRFRHPRSLSTDRFLGVYSHAPPSNHRFHSPSALEELNKDDIFLSSDFSDNSTGSNSASVSTSGLTNLHCQKTSFTLSENSGILVAIREPSRPHSHFYRKPSISTSASHSSSVSSRPPIPKPPQERILISTSSHLRRYHQSALVNVPMMSKLMQKKKDFDDDFDMDMEGGRRREMLSPHDIVARSLVQSPALANSMLEGVGRTLKGKYLRRVRNAISRQTGFLD